MYVIAVKLNLTFHGRAPQKFEPYEKVENFYSH